MKKLISCIITTKNEEEVIRQLLFSIKEQSYKNFEIILIDNNSTDKTTKIAKRFGARIFNFGPERSAQRNFGVKKARGEYVLILDADMVLNKNVLTECIEKLEEDKDLEALVIPEKSFGKGFWTKCRAFEREFYIGESSIEAARCFRKDVFLKFNGYDETMTGPEDYDLPLRISKAGNKIGRIKNYILHNEKYFSPIKSAKKKFYYAAHAQTYFKKHPEMAIKQGNLLFRPVFFRKWKKLLSHPILSIGMFMIKGIEMTGALSGIIYSDIIRKEK
jgi:glycosyltransferase involved in cell wall biosynthesis